MKTPALTATDRLTRGDDEYRHSPGWSLAGIAAATLFTGAIFLAVSQTQKATKEPEPAPPEDLRAVVVSPPPPPPESQTAAAVAMENAPPSIDLTTDAIESTQPEAVRVAAAPLAEIAEPQVQFKFELAPGAFRPKGGPDGKGKEIARIYEKAEVDQPCVPLHRVSPRIHPDMLRGTKTRRVLLLFIVGTDGAPRDLHVLQSVSREVDALVIEAVSDWTFRPAKRDRKIVSQWVQLPVVLNEGSGNPFRVN
jgi:TonB family protein